MKKKILTIISLIAVFVVYFILDYLNLPHLLGFEFSNINIDLFNVFFNSLIVVLLYLITYFEIDKVQLEKENNAKYTAHLLMTLSYKECKETITLFDDNEIIKRYIVPKVNFNGTIDKNPIMQNLQNNPFIELEHILQLAESGYICNERLKLFLSFINDYKKYISFKITFFDINDVEATYEHISLKNNITSLRNSLMQTIDKEMKLLNDDKE